MEISNALLDNISHLDVLSSCPAVKIEPSRKFYHDVKGVLKLLRPVIDAIGDVDIESSEQLSKELSEVNAIVGKAIHHLHAWNPLSSKICLVLKTESLVTRLKEHGLDICKALETLLEALPESENLECVQPASQQIDQFLPEEISNVLKESIRNFAENDEPSSENLDKIVDLLQLGSNQDILLEAVALEKVKIKAEHGDSNWEPEFVDQMIAFVVYIHERLMKAKHSQIVNGIPLPADFCCPLSLELMSDPVMVASGQTYERAFIRKWLDHGITVCPKTRQQLSHTNLIPNYTVKALIASWCESMSIKLPDPIKSAALNQPAVLLAIVNGKSDDSSTHSSQTQRSRSPEIHKPTNSSSSNGIHTRHRSHSPSPLAASSFPESGVKNDIGSMPMQRSDGELRYDVQPHVRNQTSSSSKGGMNDEPYMSHTRSDSVSSSSTDANEPSLVSGELTRYSSDVSGELVSENSSTLQREPDSPVRRIPETARRGQFIWRRPSERFVPRIVSSSSLEPRPELAEVENQVNRLIDNLQSTTLDVQREATEELRLLAKHNMDNRIVIAHCGAITHLVNLLHSSDLKTQENAVTALLNLSINDNNKIAIANAGAIEPLIDVLESGSPEAKENSAATLFSLSVLEENKVKIGQSGAIRPLVELLNNGTPRGKKDAATALFNLSILHENKARIVQAGAVKHLVELMDPAAGMVDKAVAVLANLATIQEGRIAIGQVGGIPILVEVVELGSSRGKENAAAALLLLCKQNNRFCSMVLQEGAVPPLVALSQSGTPRAREKAQTLLSHFKSQRHNSGGRG